MEYVDDAGVRQAAQAIEEIGYGHSQIRALVLGAGVAYVAELFDADLTGAAAAQFGVDPSSWWATTMATLMKNHIILGILVGALFSDVMGRRWLLLRGLGATAAASWLTILVHNYYVKTLGSLVVSISLRALFVTGLLIASECTPRGSRILHRALGVDCLNIGAATLGLLSALHHSPVACSPASSSLCLLPAAVFSSIFWALCALFLPESPAFLAGAGQYRRAREELDTMRRVNGASEGSGELRLPEESCIGRVWSLRERLEALVSRRRGRVLLLIMVSLMAVKKGVDDAMAVGPPVFFSAANLGEWYETLSSLLRIFGEVFAFANAAYFPRHVALGNAILIYAVFTFLFVAFNPLRSGGGGGFVVEAISQGAGAGLVYGCRIVLTVGYQICVEFWPTMAGATAASITIGAGYCTLWRWLWPWIKNFWPAQMAPALDVLQLALLVPLAYTFRELQKPAEGMDSGAAAGKGDPYGTFKPEA